MAELQGLGAQLSEAEQAGVEIVAVSPDPNERSQKVAEGLRLGYRFVVDRNLAVTRRYGLVLVRAGPALLKFAHLPDTRARRPRV